MRVTDVKQVRTVSAKSVKEFDKLFNQTADELGSSVVEVKEIDATTARFYYQITKKEPEELADTFMQNNAGCHCSDCPFLEIGNDARRKTFPCKYAKYGETRVDATACKVFYQEAVKKMREECKW